MRSPTGFRAALVGSGFWFVTSIAVAAIPYHVATNGDAPPTPPAQASGAFDTEDGSTTPVLDEYTVSWNCYRWQAWANAIFLTRSSGSSDQRLVFDEKAEEIYGSQDLDFGYGWGPNVGLAYCLDPCNSICVEFYGIDGWNSTGQVARNDISVLFPSGPTGYDPGVVTVNYSSNLYNTEINGRHRVGSNGWLTTIAGFRWIEISEQFGTVFETGGSATSFAIDVNNHLYGFQVGGLANIHNIGPWFFDGWLKAGIYGNSASQSTTEDYTSQPGGGRTYVSAAGSNVAFAGDLGVSVGRRITDQLSIRLGYMALWIEGVALAPEQLEASDPASGTAGLDKCGGVFYHGGFAGLDYCW
ncbi:MAG: BBP7 family outer membrane beta-barrel protein [Pirellulaceae bacterium]